ncbi:MAG: NADH-quinone oxidoreductase subunit J [Halobacterium sp.]
MTSRPRLARDINLLPGLAAVALFAVMGVVFVGANFDPTAGGFPADVSITASLGHVLFNIGGTPLAEQTPGFLAAFEIIDVVLVAALVGAVMLAKREYQTSGGER